MKHLLPSKMSTRMVPNSNCNNEQRVYLDEEELDMKQDRPCEDIDRGLTIAEVCHIEIFE